MKTYKISLDLDAKCKRCGKGGAMPNGLCMPCVTKDIQAKIFRRENLTMSSRKQDRKRKGNLRLE